MTNTTQKFTHNDKVRFVLSNHDIYNTVDALSMIIHTLIINPSQIDLTQESWWQTNNWWDDKAFVQSLQDIGVKIPSEITVKLAPLEPVDSRETPSASEHEPVSNM